MNETAAYISQLLPDVIAEDEVGFLFDHLWRTFIQDRDMKTRSVLFSKKQQPENMSVATA